MTGEDYGLMSALQGRPYMMPVSPWFYTNALKSTKNYNFKSDILWHQRWEQVLGAAPNFVQVNTRVIFLLSCGYCADVP